MAKTAPMEYTVVTYRHHTAGTDHPAQVVKMRAADRVDIIGHIVATDNTVTVLGRYNVPRDESANPANGTWRSRPSVA